MSISIDELKLLERHANHGAGVSIVRTIIHFLEQGKIKQACMARMWDADKIANYPEIESWLNQNLCDFRGKARDSLDASSHMPDNEFDAKWNSSITP